jgi:hypothetical protein
MSKPGVLLLALLCIGGGVAAAAAPARDRDRDRDGLPDRWERHYGLSTSKNSATGDPDHDRLSNRREFRLHLNPRRRDTDRDGLDDRAEITRYKTNPRKADTDGDGVNDGTEVRKGTNPRRKDSDGDGASDGNEIAAGTDPTDPTSHPAPRPATPAPTVPSSPDAVGCVGALNSPGGPDPWGGCWPGPQNTGYPRGLPGDTRRPVTLTAYTGPTTIRSCGVVIDSKRVDQTVLIQAGNGTKSKDTPCVTIRNSLISGVVFAEQQSFGPLLIEDTEVRPPDLPWWENIGRSNVFAYRVNSHGGEGVIKCDSNCEAKDNWVHGMRLGGQYHYNAFGGNGTDNFRIIHNYASCGDWESVVSPGGDAGCSAVIGFYGDFGPIQNITIDHNFLASTFDVSSGGLFRQAGYCLNPGYYPGKPYPDTHDLTVTENVFARGGSGKCGVYGPTNSLNARGQPNGNVWTGNRYTDGTVIPRPEE